MCLTIVVVDGFWVRVLVRVAAVVVEYPGRVVGIVEGEADSVESQQTTIIQWSMVVLPHLAMLARPFGIRFG